MPDMVVTRTDPTCEVRVFDGTNLSLISSFCIGPSGWAEVMVASDPGSQPLVRILDGLSLSLIDEFFAEPAPLAGGLFLAPAERS